jgi:hypothetical protein
VSRFAKMRCIVRNCSYMTGLQLCHKCSDMLRRGELDRNSTAWFVTELVFMEQQNDAAMKQVKYLHDKVNELARDGK